MSPFYRKLTWLISLALIAWALAFAFWPIHGHAQQLGPIYCSQQAAAAAGFTTKTQVVAPAATGTARIFVCGYVASAALTGNITFQTGTGSNCATNSQAIGPTIQLPATGTFTDGSGVFRGFLVTNPNALCATASTAANLTIYFELQ
jgi:hypothetical protein